MAERTSKLIENILLRDVIDADLPIFFEQQLDPQANYMAAFTAEDPTNLAAFTAHWAKIRAFDNVINKTIVADGQVVGNVASFVMFDQLQVSYWLGKEYWGKGIATRALSELLKLQTVRPIYGRAARDNFASIRVLEKCGFVLRGYEKAFANARNAEIEEAILKLE
jgi:RimJ/RimL family protein N-acetyltransferase